jgi:hypothetical protein
MLKLNGIVFKDIHNFSLPLIGLYLVSIQGLWYIPYQVETYLCYIHTYHSRFIPKGVAEASQIFLRDTHVLPKLFNYEEQCRRDRW